MRVFRMHQACRPVLLGLVLCIAAVGGCASPVADSKIDFELTGTVFDAVTRRPVEGAYVLAGYMIWIEGAHDRADRCVKTRGMYTGKDGRFRFPVEKLDGLSPSPVPSAIKPGYFRGNVKLPERSVWQKQGPEAYADHDVYLNPQDSAKPNFEYAYGHVSICQYAKTREDAAAAIEFLRIELAEITSLRASPQGIDATRVLLKKLEALPTSTVQQK